MNIFNSLGSNYDITFALKALSAQNKNQYSFQLKKMLEEKYEGRAILLYKGREAIGLALEILNLPKESFVAINGFTCFAVYKAVVNEGLDAEILDLEYNFPNRHSGEPELVEGGSRISNGKKRFSARQNDELDLNFTANKLSKSIRQNPKIKVVIIQNTLGYPCDIEKISKICKDNNIILIEDLAHSVGAKYANGKEAGTVGDFVILSFSQDKMIDAVSGGALIIRNKKYQNYYSSSGMSDSERSREVSNETMKQLNNLNLKQQLLDRFYPLFTFIIRKTYGIGFGKPLHFLLKTFNLLSKPMNKSFYEKHSLPNWYAYLVLENFKKLETNLEHRRNIAAIYNSMLNKKILSKIISENIKLSSNLRFPIFVENRNDLIGCLKKERAYVSDIWYDSVDETLPNAKVVSNKILNLPTHENVSEEDAKNISETINRWIEIHLP